jgi:hypothetical protein
VLQAVDSKFDRIQGVHVAKVAGHRDPFVHEIDDRLAVSGGIVK